MSDSSVPVPTFGPAGFVAPDEQDVLNGVQADMNAAFGGGLNLSLSTPQGQLATTQAAAIAAAYEVFISIVNGVDPAFADGRMQDALGRIYFLTRKAAVATVVTCQCVGANGTVIPQGTLAQDTQGNLYATLGDAVIPVGGSVNVQFAALEAGPTPCPAGSLTAIYQAIPGWDSITNAADGVIGQNVESRRQFEQRRQQSVQKNAVGPMGAIQAALLSVDGVTDVFCVDNPTAAPVTVGGVTIAARSVYCCVNGGTDQTVALAILSKKAPGAGYVGTTTVTVTDQSPGYSPPYPSYTVKFTRPAATRIYFAVTLANGPTVPSDGAAQVKTAILNAFTGEDGGLRPTISSTIFALRFASAVAALGSWAQLETIAIGTAAAPTGGSVTVAADHVPTLGTVDIAVSFV